MNNNKQNELINQYRNQISLKTDLLKGKCEELKKKEKEYKTGIETITEKYNNDIIHNTKEQEKEIKELKEEHNASIEILNNMYNELIYTSERKYKKLEQKQNSFLSYIY
tara:strand:- start:74 stop:400 length:327 start_codon:yes stop_codon:yes gene_type:complete